MKQLTFKLVSLEGNHEGLPEYQLSCHIILQVNQMHPTETPLASYRCSFVAPLAIWVSLRVPCHLGSKGHQDVRPLFDPYPLHWCSPSRDPFLLSCLLVFPLKNLNHLEGEVGETPDMSCFLLVVFQWSGSTFRKQ